MDSLSHAYILSSGSHVLSIVLCAPRAPSLACPGALSRLVAGNISAIASPPPQACHPGLSRTPAPTAPSSTARSSDGARSARTLRHASLRATVMDEASSPCNEAPLAAMDALDEARARIWQHAASASGRKFPSSRCRRPPSLAAGAANTCTRPVNRLTCRQCHSDRQTHRRTDAPTHRRTDGQTHKRGQRTNTDRSAHTTALAHALQSNTHLKHQI